MSVPRQAAKRMPGLLETMAADVKHLRWMVQPAASLRLIILVVVLWTMNELSGYYNVFSHFIFISYPLPRSPQDNGVRRYGKGANDLLFLAFYIVVFSFIRQTAIEYIVKPIASKGGIRGERKLERFTEQGYALLYWGTASIVGLAVMSRQPTWWYETKAFWIDYPHWRMQAELKTYYLLQFSYWLQQLLVLVLGLEKPRSDFRELCLHHVVTLWLIGWSYAINLTYIGVAIFFSMDIADVFLALSKLLNYLKLQRTSEVSFGILLCVWSYFRHYQNLRILHSVWYEYDLYVPRQARVFRPFDGVALSWWMKYQVFCPILALQALNLFWYALMWRIVLRMLAGTNASDTREETEEEEDDDEKEA